MKTLALLFLVWPAILGCSGGPLLPVPAALQGGGASVQDVARTVVYMEDRAGNFCGGVLIGPTLLLTAEHCLVGKMAPIFATPANSASDRTRVGPILASGSRALSGMSATARDMAVAETGFMPAGTSAIARLDRPLREGEPVQAWIPVPSDTGAVRISKIDCPVLGQAGAVVEFACQTRPGASGSPMFIEDRGTLVLAAILTGRGQGATAGIAVATHASAVNALGY